MDIPFQKSAAPLLGFFFLAFTVAALAADLGDPANTIPSPS